MVFQKHETSPQLLDYLKVIKLLPENGTVAAVEKPGSGNMNFVMRVKTNRGRTFILKQAKAWVEKYPQVAAPAERAEMEAKFYKAIRKHEVLRGLMPKLLFADAENHILVLEDLGQSSDYTRLYQKGENLSPEEGLELVNFLNALHHLPKPKFPANLAMRTLNHEHIFNFPFLENNGFDLDGILPGLQKVAKPFKKDKSLKKRIRDLGKIYLSRRGKVLLQGDFYPGSWLKTESGIRIIDPEFGFVGRPEFDLGVFVAHLKMSEHGEGFIQKTLENYQRPEGFDEKLMLAFSGVEILRRVLGLAQLPLSLSLGERLSLLEEGSSSIQNQKK